MEFQNRLRLYCKSKGITQKKVADAIGYSAVHVNHYFKDRDPNWDFLHRLSISFPELDMNYLIRGEEYFTSTINEPGITYNKKVSIIEDIEAKLQELKQLK